MIDLKYILNNEKQVKEALQKRSFDLAVIDEIIAKGKKRNDLIYTLSQKQAKRNEISETIGIKKRNKEDCEELFKEVALVKEEIDNIEKQTNDLINEVNKLLLLVPNMPYEDVPYGVDENDNITLKEHNTLGRGLVEVKKAHYEIAADLDLVDFVRAVKLAKTRFVLYKNDGAKLVRALANFMLDTHIANGYKEIMPAHLVNSDMLYGTGQLPKFAEDLFKIENEDLWLIPTAEVPVTNYHYDEILNLDKPIKYVAYTKCFRSEAGSSGKDTRGL
ncbi:aminoacyl--tRNA ligase-related protein, partial [Mycoplasma struthionis]